MAQPATTTTAKLAPAGIALAIGGAFLFSTKPVLVKLAYVYHVDAVTLMALRMVFALPFYLAFAAIAVRERKKAGIKTDLSGTVFIKSAAIGFLGYYCASYLDLVGLTMITAQFERLIIYTYPGFVLLLGALFFGHRVSARMIAALVIIYSGLAVIFGQDLALFGDQVTRGALYVGLSSLTFSGYILLAGRPIKKLGSRLFTSIAMIAASTAILLHFALTHSIGALELPLMVYALALAIAVVGTVIPSFMIAAALASIGPGPTSIFSGIGPVFTTLLGISLLAEPFTRWHFLGMVLVISGTLVLSWGNSKTA